MHPFRKDDWIQFGKRCWWQIFLLQAVFLLAVGAFAAWQFLPSTLKEPVADSLATTIEGQQQADSAVTKGETHSPWWTCAMHPQIRRQQPGKCPICQMELVSVQPSTEGLRTLTISPAVRDLMKVETSPVERRYVAADVRMVGKIEFDETRLAHITAWVSGRLDRLYVDYTGVQVNKGDHMVYIYSEELYSIQEELIQSIKFQRENQGRLLGRLDLVEAAREKLRRLGLTDGQIREIEQRNHSEDHVTIYAPAGGVVIEKLKQIGDRVRTGDRIYTIADLNQVWVKLDAYESDLQWIRYGQTVSFTTEAYPGEKFTGRIAFIDPVLNKNTRTVKVRVNVSNKDGRLKPEMFVRAAVSSNIAAGGRVMDPDLAGKWISPMHPEIVRDQPGNCDICGMPLVRAETLGYVAAEAGSEARPLVIPSSAALVTGTRSIVYVEVEGAREPTYEGREVLLGPRAGDYYLVRNGLFDGEIVVTNGSFKIDSALQIQAKPTMMTPEGGGAGGHDHGGSAEKAAARNEHSSPMEMELPKGFASRLKELILLGEQVSFQARSGSIDNTRESFAAFAHTLNRVNAEGLADHPAMLWKELLMLLGNDSIEGSEANDMQTALRVESSMRNNIRRMQEQFMLTRAGQGDIAAAKTRRLTISTEFRMQLSEIFHAYLRLQDALATDDAFEAGEAIGAVQSSLLAISDQSLNAMAANVWSGERRHLDQIVNRLGVADNITAVRAEFAMLSDQMLVLVRRFGVSEVGNVYELHCPMAFENRGAIWIQADKQPRNPYFGRQMLHCADRVELIINPGTDQGGHHHE